MASDADIVVAAGGTKSSKLIDPLLKFYVDRPVMINDNIDGEKSKANHAVICCTFKSVKLKNGYQDCEMINIDGFYI